MYQLGYKFMKLLYSIKQKTATLGINLNSGRGILKIKRSNVKRLALMSIDYSSSPVGISIVAFNASVNASCASSAETDKSSSVSCAALRAARFS